MASGVNRVTLVGNLGRDPEVRYTQGGTPVCNLSVAVTERRKEADAWKDHTEWFNVVCFGKTAENAGKFLKKGRQLFVEGRLQSRSWEDKEGHNRTTVEVIASQVLFLGGGGREQGDFPESRGGNDTSERFTSSSEFVEDDDIPF